MDLLQEQIEKMSKSIKTDSYQMSIGEIAGLYKDGDLNISPVYQRLFRWDIDQQSTLIESILLQIPIPPIYVFQSEDGKWSLIDGQQRLSTIFKFMGILKKDNNAENQNNELYQREPLTKTKFLPALEGKFWEDDDPEKSFTEAQRRYIKRSKILIIIIDKSSDSFAQYEMFQRLNTGGSHLSPQEIRNCILVMHNENIFNRLKKMSELEVFRKATPISEKEAEEQGYLELVVKFFILRYSDFNVSDSENFNNFITDEILQLLDKDKLDLDNNELIFQRVFQLLSSVMGEDSFKKYDPSKQSHIGPVLVGAFEVIIPGLVDNLEFFENNPAYLKEKIDNLYLSNEYIDASKRGIRPVARIRKLALASKRLLRV
ncbi:MAG: DUF262 domain-containing protein [Anaerolineaceae bacterium]|nr:DUF262 domain-containing protein [Anaerolineaceae bacterium]